MSFDEFDDFEADDWHEEEKNIKEVEPAEVVKDDPDEIPTGRNIGLVGEQWSGKSLLMTLFGYLNTDYFDKFDVKENYPNVYTLIKEGYAPEVEELVVIDLDNSYKKRSKSDVFGRLAKPLYREGRINRITIKIPKVQVDTLNAAAREASIIRIDNTKQKIENTIAQYVAENDPGKLLAIDSMGSYDELLNDKFRVLFETALSDDGLGASFDGIRQNKWAIRNSWWIETLRGKRNYDGWQIDIYKQKEKGGKWLALEIDRAKKYDYLDPNKVKPFKVKWAPDTEYDLDQVWYLRNHEDTDYFVKAFARSRKKKELKGMKNIFYTKNRRRAVYEILEELAPKMMGVVVEDGEELTDDELW